VEKGNPDLVARDAKGVVERVPQRAPQSAGEGSDHCAAAKKGMEAVTARLQEQDSKIQKVSDQLELNKTAPRTVVNNQ
jgi:hypothetical protein